MSSVDESADSAAADDAPQRIAVKLGPDAAEAVRNGVTTVGAILDRAVPGISSRIVVRPLFEGIPRDGIEALERRAMFNDPTYRPPRMDDWFDVELDPELAPDDVTADRIIRLVRQLPGVIVVDAHPLRPARRTARADVAAEHRNLAQKYLDDLGARDVRSEAGGRGDGIGFIDVERGWNLDHEDLKAAGILLISGDNRDFRPHGTAALGIVLMDEANNTGGVGIAPDSSGRVMSVYRPAYNTAAAIVAASLAMVPGDVMLLEVHEHEPVFGTDNGPAEVLLANFEQIEFAVKADRVVVQAAGNGMIDLDAYAPDGMHIFTRAVRDSGAFFVAAAGPTAPHARNGTSNFGSRIDFFGWDDLIDTTTTDDDGVLDHSYTTTFGETSGAAAMVAGAALVAQSMAAHTTGRLTPAELLVRLKIGATNSSSPGTGVMPNLRAIADNT